MTNKKLIRLFILILLLVTGMNSYSDLLLCHHMNGSVHVVLGEYHNLVHGLNDCHNEEGPGVRSYAQCHSCFDIPLQIRNGATLNSGISITIRNEFRVLDDRSGFVDRSFPVSAKISEDQFPNRSSLRLYESIVLLI